MNTIQKLVSIGILIILIIILTITKHYYNFASSINIVVSIIAIMAFFGGYSKLMDLFDLKSDLIVEKVEVIQDRTHILITIKNKGDAYSYNPYINFAVLNENNEVMDSGTGLLFGSAMGILPSESIQSKKFGIKKQLEQDKKYKIFIAVGENEYYQDLEL